MKRTQQIAKENSVRLNTHGLPNDLRFSDEEYQMVYEAVRDYGFHK